MTDIEVGSPILSIGSKTYLPHCDYEDTNQSHKKSNHFFWKYGHNMSILPKSWLQLECKEVNTVDRFEPATTFYRHSLLKDV